MSSASQTSPSAGFVRPSRAVTRRTLLGTTLAAVAAGAVGCQVDTGGAAGGGQAPAADGGLTFPDYPTTVEGSGTLSWLDSGDLKAVFEEAALTAFSTKHPEIQTTYQGTGWETVTQVLSVGLRNRSAPDVFALPPDNTIPPQTAIAEGWVRPIEDLIPDFEAWRRNWPETGLIPGVHIFDGKLYNFPLNSSRRLDKLLFVDNANLRAAGYDDPIAGIRTWDDIHAALKSSVAQGSSGLMLGRDALGATVAALATTLGWTGALNGWPGMDFSTGRFGYDAPEVVEAFEFVQRLVTDGLVVPGFLTLADKDAREQFSAGGSAMMFVGPYSLPAWKRNAPGWEFAVGQLPSRDGSDYVVPFAETGANAVWVYAETDVPQAVGQVLAYMGSPEGQQQMVILSEGNLESLQQEANDAADRDGRLDPNATFCSDLAARIMHTVPQVELRNADVATVRLVLEQPTPVWSDLLQGFFTGDLSDPQAEFAAFNDRQDAALDAAIAEAAEQGSTVTRDDFVFANWDPLRDYTADDYRDL